MLVVSWKDRLTNKTIKERTQLLDILQMLKTSKRNWAGHAARATNNWATEVLSWAPIGKRNSGRLKTRRSVDITRMYGNNWREMAQDRMLRSDRRSNSGAVMTDNDDCSSGWSDI